MQKRERWNFESRGENLIFQKEGQMCEYCGSRGKSSKFWLNDSKRSFWWIKWGILFRKEKFEIFITDSQTFSQIEGNLKQMGGECIINSEGMNAPISLKTKPDSMTVAMLCGISLPYVEWSISWANVTSSNKNNIN